jgi:hypothetical protein
MRTLILSCLALVIAIMAMIATPAAAQDPGPIGGALATLSAATVQAQMIRQAQEATYSAQRATIQAVMIEQTRTAAQVQATSTSISAQSTQSALDELQRQRSMTATAQRAEIIATATALVQSADATATYEALNTQATRETYHAAATSQAALWSEQATAVARQNETANLRQERFSIGLLIVEVGFIAGALLIIAWLTRTCVLWTKRLAPQPVNDISSPTQVLINQDQMVIDQQEMTQPRTPSGQQSRLPTFVTAIDDPRMVETLDQWAERYDAKHGVTNGD